MYLTVASDATVTTMGSAIAEMPDTAMPKAPGRLRRSGAVTRPRILSTVSVPAADTLYCELMVTHHKYGIHMAEAIGERTALPRVDELAASMVRGQQGEIKALTEYGERSDSGNG